MGSLLLLPDTCAFFAARFFSPLGRIISSLDCFDAAVTSALSGIVVVVVASRDVAVAVLLYFFFRGWPHLGLGGNGGNKPLIPFPLVYVAAAAAENGLIDGATAVMMTVTVKVISCCVMQCHLWQKG